MKTSCCPPVVLPFIFTCLYMCAIWIPENEKVCDKKEDGSFVRLFSSSCIVEHGETRSFLFVSEGMHRYKRQLHATVFSSHSLSFNLHTSSYRRKSWKATSVYWTSNPTDGIPKGLQLLKHSIYTYKATLIRDDEVEGYIRVVVARYQTIKLQRSL